MDRFTQAAGKLQGLRDFGDSYSQCHSDDIKGYSAKMDVNIYVTFRGFDYKSPFWAIGEDVKALPQKEFDRMIKKK
jgi:hypothetical protein